MYIYIYILLFKICKQGCSILTKLPHYPSLSLSEMVGHNSATELSVSQVWGPVTLGVGSRTLTGTENHLLATWLKDHPVMSVTAISGASTSQCPHPGLRLKNACSDIGSARLPFALWLPGAPLWPSLILPACTLVSCSARPPHSSASQRTTADPSQPSGSDSGKLHLWAGKLYTAYDLRL